MFTGEDGDSPQEGGRRAQWSGSGGSTQGSFIPMSFPPCRAPGDTEGICEHLVGVAHGSLGKQLCMMKE